MYTAGDEFAFLLPGADEAITRRRAQEVEAGLDALRVAPPLDDVYRGASVGFRAAPGGRVAWAEPRARQRVDARAKAAASAREATSVTEAFIAAERSGA